jgi:hypothetical protein
MISMTGFTRATIRTFHVFHWSRSPQGLFSLAAACCLIAFLGGIGQIAAAQRIPVPFVNQPLVPSAVAPGGPSFTLTVNGTEFVSGSTVNWNGVALATTFVSSSQLTATVPSGNIANAGTASITVSSPTPGGGTSSPIYLGVTNPISPLIFTNYFESLYFAGTFVTPYANGPFAGEFNNPVAGDFNNDGKLDLAFIAYEVISTTSPTFQTCIELGNGDGSFQLPNCTAVSPPMAGMTESPYWLIAADFNGDGKLDLALSNWSDGTNTVSIFLGNGDGTLQAPQSFPSGPTAPGNLCAGDFDGDGKLDLAVSNALTGAGAENISILLGNGDGTFQNPTEYSAPSNSVFLAVGDFNRDGKLDLILSNAGTNVYVGLGNGDGTFQPPQIVATLAETPESLVTADVNGDGKLDLVTLTSGVSSNIAGVAVLLGNGDGTFQPPVTYSTPYFSYGGPVIADINGDGKPDLLLAPWSRGSGSTNTTLVSALIGNGDGTFQPAINLPTPALPVGGTGGPAGLLAGDFNGDGKVDILLPYVNTDPSETPTDSFFFFVQGSFPVAGSSPTSITFARQTVGSTSSPQSVKLTNLGSTALALSGITVAGQNAGDFVETNQCTASLAVGASCQINVTFTPTGFGNRNGILAIANDGLGGTIGVALTGTTPPGASVSLSPLNFSFSSQYVGTSGLPQTLTVTNTGSAALIITNVATSAVDFGTLSNCTNSVPPNANCTIGVFFDPTASGTRSGTLTITDNATGSPQTVTLAGTGQDFSMAPTSSASATVSPGQSTTYNLTVAPGGGFNQTVTLSCTGAPDLGTCSVSPASVTLSGTSSSTATVTVTTTASTTGLMQPIGMPPNGGALRSAAFLAMFGLMLLSIQTSWRRITGRQRVTCGFAFLMPIALVAIPGCSGSSSNSHGTGGTPAGSYNLTVTGTFSSPATTLTHATKLTLVVQ